MKKPWALLQTFQFAIAPTEGPPDLVHSTAVLVSFPLSQGLGSDCFHRITFDGVDGFAWT